jgi:hypothetical protein
VCQYGALFGARSRIPQAATRGVSDPLASKTEFVHVHLFRMSRLLWQGHCYSQSFSQLNDSVTMRIRIGTWNLQGRWSQLHRDLLTGQSADLWLLTEVNSKILGSPGIVTDFHCHTSGNYMQKNRHWSAVLSRAPHEVLADPHAASAAVRVEGITYCSSVLPWAGCGRQLDSPWIDGSPADKTSAAVGEIINRFPGSKVVWGGDWNQNLSGGRQFVGSTEMRDVIESALLSMNLKVPTRDLPRRLPGFRSIDHIAIPTCWNIGRAERIPAEGLSDHEAYVVEVETTEW